jgi:mannose-6-phosphate isomerase-like protein (cupin superfamily)
MNRKLILRTVGLLSFACPAFAAETNSSSDGVIHLKNETVAAAFAKGGPLITTNTFKVQAGHRVEAGEVELHEHETDIFYVVEGTAKFVTGGSIVEPRTVSPGQVRGKEIRGGEERTLTKGDIIVIPTRVPHWYKEVKGPFDYYVVKVLDKP